VKKYVFDIDGTICTNASPDYDKAQPYKKRIEMVNNLYEQGNTIIFHTARGMGRHHNNSTLADLAFYNLTKQQLDSWGVKYHHLFLGKPSGDIYVDDKGISDEEFFSN